MLFRNLESRGIKPGRFTIAGCFCSNPFQVDTCLSDLDGRHSGCLFDAGYAFFWFREKSIKTLTITASVVFAVPVMLSLMNYYGAPKKRYKKHSFLDAYSNRYAEALETRAVGVICNRFR